MKWIRCKTEGVAYQDEKLRMQQIGAVDSEFGGRELGGSTVYYIA